MHQLPEARATWMLGQLRIEQTFQEFYEELRSELDSERTLVFVDTNVLGDLFRLFTSARVELLDWFKELAAENRLCMPAWVATEYFHRVAKKGLDEFAPKASDVNSVLRQLDQHLKIARLSMDEKTLKASNFAEGREAFLNLLGKRIAELKEPLEILRKQSPESGDVHQEIVEVLGKTVLSTDVGALAERAATKGEVRFKQRMPPGFRDGKKEENPYGDLCIWLEVLEHAAAVQATYDAFVFLGNDGKVDWSYLPQLRRQPKSKTGYERNSDPDIRLADPRLVNELRAAAGPGKKFRIASVADVVRDGVANAVLAGMFYEVYFNRKGAFRTEFKARYLSALLAVLGNKRFAPTRAFIQRALKDHRGSLVVLPGDERTEIPVTLQVEGPCDQPREICTLTRILVDGRSSLLEAPEDAEDGWQVREEQLLDMLGTNYALPSDWVSFLFDPPSAEKRMLRLPSNRVFKSASDLVSTPSVRS
ncbi:PIN-like domain-containing protein [Cystobacter ferrugineus]|uniref:PIN like domain-containing protein n=1 Tax=Cystobacter ferrugineus TaxID=83449 RepID=A0A1L9B2J3_9BACT|nr:PIN-like domain-containing protein [Cystobacter ferrugineus]OJH36495.1 hypothetical protein BON30_32560 [Cystobacter ferrugineus]